MNIQDLDKTISKVQVKNLENANVEVINESPLMMIGKGRQGAVFQVNEDICVKVFGNTEDCEREYYALSLGQHTGLLPKVYAKGSLYIAMEIIKGVDIREYLQSQPLTKELSIKLIEMLITFKEIGYERIDHHKRQIYIQPDGQLRVIDVARTVWRDRVYPYPRKLLNSLGNEYKEVFLTHVQELAPSLYEEWRHYIRMEEISSHICQQLMKLPPGTDKVKKKSDKLLTTKDEKEYVVLLEGLVHKVFKEEWVKAMLARGYNIDEVKEKIDELYGDMEINGLRVQDLEAEEPVTTNWLLEKKKQREKKNKRKWGRMSNKEKQRKWEEERSKEKDGNRKEEKNKDKNKDKDKKKSSKKDKSSKKEKKNKKKK